MPSLFTAQPCDSTDPEPGVRLVRNGEVLNRLTASEARGLAYDLLTAAEPGSSIYDGGEMHGAWTGEPGE